MPVQREIDALERKTVRERKKRREAERAARRAEQSAGEAPSTRRCSEQG